MNLTKLSDDELNEYIDSLAGQTDEENQELFINRCVKKIYNTEVVVKKIQEDLRWMKAYIKDNDIKSFGNVCIEAISRINTCYNNLNTLINNVGIVRGAIEDDTCSEKERVDFEELDGNILKIRFHSLLPKRNVRVNNKSTLQYKIIHTRYKNAFSDYFKDKKYRVYGEKVVLFFIHHYSEESRIRDHDNFEVKFIIDYIAGYLLVDDSAKYCAHYTDYVLDNADFSEIYVVPQSKFAYFYRSLQ